MSMYRANWKYSATRSGSSSPACTRASRSSVEIVACVFAASPSRTDPHHQHLIRRAAEDLPREPHVAHAIRHATHRRIQVQLAPIILRLAMPLEHQLQIAEHLVRLRPLRADEELLRDFLGLLH